MPRRKKIIWGGERFRRKTKRGGPFGASLMDKKNRELGEKARRDPIRRKGVSNPMQEKGGGGGEWGGKKKISLYCQLESQEEPGAQRGEEKSVEGRVGWVTTELSDVCEE